MVDTTGSNLAHDKKYNQYTTERPSVLKMTRPGKKSGEGATKRRKQVQDVWMTPGVVIQQREVCPCANVSKVRTLSFSRVGGIVYIH
jgi:hypothetical protein